MNNINVTNITNVYNVRITNVNVNRVSYNGGSGGIEASPTAAEEAAARERHVPPSLRKRNKGTPRATTRSFVLRRTRAGHRLQPPHDRERSTPASCAPARQERPTTLRRIVVRLSRMRENRLHIPVSRLRLCRVRRITSTSLRRRSTPAISLRPRIHLRETRGTRKRTGNISNGRSSSTPSTNNSTSSYGSSRSRTTSACRNSRPAQRRFSRWSGSTSNRRCKWNSGTPRSSSSWRDRHLRRTMSRPSPHRNGTEA